MQEHNIEAPLAERLVQLRNAVREFARSLSRDEANANTALLSTLGTLNAHLAEVIATEADRVDGDYAVEMLLRSGLMRADGEVTVYTGDGVLHVFGCFFCGESIRREDAADAWERQGWVNYAAMDEARKFDCPPSPTGDHGVICADCQGRGCMVCDGHGATA
jgi:hypothetical protein